MNAPEGGVVDLVNGIIADAATRRASDVHIDPGDNDVRVAFRIDGVLQENQRLPLIIGPNVVARLKVMAGLLTYRSDIPQEGAIPAKSSGVDTDVRVATLPTIAGERVVLRLMANTARFFKLDDLGHSPARVERLRHILASPLGLFLVVGPAGSGKTTTLAAMLSHIAKTRPGVSILSVEDPVEIRIPGVTQVEL
ncbi:MAG: Flp pilus assembly complex ATPase component TadA, partial [Phycisphaerales bacterium]|nr:Flp pilus assembly complex ATPase component TadA [Phycisphaerales bacterium]